MKNKTCLILVLVIVFMFTLSSFALGQKTVADLKYVEMAHYSWIRLASYIPEVTDRIILPIGTIESHGATCLGSDTYIPINLAKLASRKCNAFVAPAITHGATGLDISKHPGAITIRENILIEYIYDVLQGLVASGFRNIFIMNGHGGNTDAITEATGRIFNKYNGKIRILVSNWWTIPKGEEISMEAFSLPKHDIGAHGGLEEAALNQSINPDFFDWEIFEELGPSKVANVFEEGYQALPAPYTMGYYGYYPTKNIQATKKFTQMIADYYAETFNKAVEAWDFLEKYDKGVK